jgi:peptide-methionine (S)-S-oxide reductase
MNHYLNGIDLNSEAPAEYNEIIFGAGCFWGVERKFWQLDGVWLTSVGYAGGDIKNPTYEQVCYKNTNHAEVVKVIYDPKEISLSDLLKVFWECHDPTQGMRQGNDKGTQYRSVIYCSSEKDLKICEDTKNKYQNILLAKNYDKITTEIILAPTYYLAEEYHQQYLAKNPNGYCGLGGTGCSIDL